MQERKLGFWETYSHLGHEWFYGLATIAVALFVKGKVNLDILKKAFFLVYKRHPLLQTTIYEKEGGYYFSFNHKFQNIPLNNLRRKDNKSWEKVFEKNLNIMLNTKKYLWKADLIIGNSHSEIILAFHHSIIDGLSLRSFIYDLFFAYSKVEKDSNFVFTPLPLKPPVEFLLPKNMTKEKYFTICKNKTKCILSPGIQKNLLPVNQRYTKFIYRQLSKMKTNKLLTKCIENKVNINSLLNSLLLVAAQNVRKEDLCSSIINPFSLRQYCKPKLSLEDIGCYSYPIITCYNVSSLTNIWDLAEDYQQKIIKEIKMYSALPNTITVNEIKNILSSKKLYEKKSFQWEMFLTNTGKLRIQGDYGSLKLFSSIGGLNLRPETIVFSVATGIFNGKIWFLFLYIEPLISKGQTEEFVSYYMDEINKI